METGYFAHQVHADHCSPIHISSMLSHFCIHSLHTGGQFEEAIN